MKRTKEDLMKVIDVQGQAFKKLHVIIENKNQEIEELNKEIISLGNIIKCLKGEIKDYKVTLKRVKGKLLKESRKNK